MGAMLMLEIREAGGLCSTCNNAPTCYHRATRGPAVFCEMFDNGVTPPNRAVTELPLEHGAAADEDGSLRGLCMNCGNRRTCMHPRPSGGVWHCEDYE